MNDESQPLNESSQASGASRGGANKNRKRRNRNKNGGAAEESKDGAAAQQNNNQRRGGAGGNGQAAPQYQQKKPQNKQNDAPMQAGPNKNFNNLGGFRQQAAEAFQMNTRPTVPTEEEGFTGDKETWFDGK